MFLPLFAWRLSRPRLVFLASAALVWLISGCAGTATYLIEVRDVQTKKPMANAHVTAETTTRFYSHIDPRFYLCPRTVTDKGQTMANGKVIVNLPDDRRFGGVVIDDYWGTGISFPDRTSVSDWTPAFTEEEASQKDFKREDPPRPVPGRPEIKVTQQNVKTTQR